MFVTSNNVLAYYLNLPELNKTNQG